MNGKIFVFGGDVEGHNKPTSQVEMYNPATDTWTILNNMPTAREYFSATTVEGKIYIIGGQNVGRLVPEILAFDPELPSSIKPAGKLSTTWGEIKAAQ
jgi:hypothetical protein